MFLLMEWPLTLHLLRMIVLELRSRNRKLLIRQSTRRGLLDRAAHLRKQSGTFFFLHFLQLSPRNILLTLDHSAFIVQSICYAVASIGNRAGKGGRDLHGKLRVIESSPRIHAEIRLVDVRSDAIVGLSDDRSLESLLTAQIRLQLLPVDLEVSVGHGAPGPELLALVPLSVKVVPVLRLLLLESCLHIGLLLLDPPFVLLRQHGLVHPLPVVLQQLSVPLLNLLIQLTVQFRIALHDTRLPFVFVFDLVEDVALFKILLSVLVHLYLPLDLRHHVLLVQIQPLPLIFVHALELIFVLLLSLDLDPGVPVHQLPVGP